MLKLKREGCIQTSVERVLADFLDHENLDQFFNAKFRIVKDASQDTLRGGAGCIREVSILGVTFHEEIISADERGIVYRVLGNFPVSKHRGHISFRADQNKTFVSYEIQCKANWYLPSFILTPLLTRDLKNCLQLLKQKYAAN